jgi:hypothetical protein
MSVFLNLYPDEGLINADQIDRIVAVEGKRGVSCAFLRDHGGGSVKVIGSIEEIGHALLPTVPAGDGYTLLTFFKSGNVERTPIVAWRLAGLQALPICPGYDWQEVVSHGQRWILMSDGQVVGVCGDGAYENEAAWLASMQAEASKPKLVK